jgi:hypothetical protein
LEKALISEYGFMMHWKLVGEFRKGFPQSHTHYWYFGGIVWLFSFVGAGAFILFQH